MRRREFLSAMAASPMAAAARGRNTKCILLVMVGGPSQLDTWDLKPGAPADVRGPFRPIKTNVPGIEISEIFPRLARHADKYSLIRSVHQEASPVHGVGLQLIQTGRRSRHGVEHPHVGCEVSRLLGSRHVLVPGPIGATGGNLSHGQEAAEVGRIDLQGEPQRVRERYGRNQFGASCLMARRLVESGVRFVTVNMFHTVFGQPTWDAHGYEPFCSLSCYRDHVGPMFDSACAALFEDLDDRGLLGETMVLAMGEFGRTPKLNFAGGRDHWTGCWSVLLGGGPLKRGEVIGSSDEIAAYPKERPVRPAEIVATIYSAFGVLAVPGAKPIHELIS